MTKAVHSRRRRALVRRCSGTVLGTLMAVVAATAAPAAATTQSYSSNGGVYTHSGTVGPIIGGGSCARYRNMLFVADYQGAVTVKDTASGTTHTFNDHFTVTVEHPLDPTGGNDWYEFADGSHAVAGCTDAAGATWIDNFKISIDGVDGSVGTARKELDCTDDDSSYKRSGVDIDFTSDKNNAQDAGCEIRVDADGDGAFESTFTDSTVQITLDETLLACNSPIAPPNCVSTGSISIIDADA